MRACCCSLAGTKACDNCANKIEYDDGFKTSNDWWSANPVIWAEMRGMRNLLNIQKQRIDALEKVYYSTHGG